MTSICTRKGSAEPEGSSLWSEWRRKSTGSRRRSGACPPDSSRGAALGKPRGSCTQHLRQLCAAFILGTGTKVFVTGDRFC